MELFTKEEFREEVVSFFDYNEDMTNFNELDIERCVSEKINEFKAVLQDFFCYAYENCSISEGVSNTLDEWLEKNKNKPNETSVD